MKEELKKLALKKRREVAFWALSETHLRQVAAEGFEGVEVDTPRYGEFGGEEALAAEIERLETLGLAVNRERGSQNHQFHGEQWDFLVIRWGDGPIKSRG